VVLLDNKVSESLVQTRRFRKPKHMSDRISVEPRIPYSRNTDTRRSWRVGRSILVWLTSFVAAIIGFFATYSEAAKGDTIDSLARFEGKLKNYIRSAVQNGEVKIRGVGSDSYYVTIDSTRNLKESALQLSNAVNDLSYQNRSRAVAVINQAVAEYNYSRSGDDSDLKVHTDKSLDAIERGWVTVDTFSSIIKALGIAVLSGAAGWITMWMFVCGTALLWWFLMDRIHDISRAIRGQ